MDIKDTGSSEINVLPAFGSSASFSTTLDVVQFGSNITARSLQGINALKMQLNLNFNELTDTETNNLLSFLQDQFYYSPQSYSNDGSFSNKRLIPFDYQPFYPYKLNKFNCLDYNHNKSHYNVNSVSAKFDCIGSSILDSVNPNFASNSSSAASYDLGVVETNSDGNIVADITNNSDMQIILFEGSELYKPNSYETISVLSFPHVINANATETIEVSPNASSYSNGLTCHTSLKNSIYIDDPQDCWDYPYTSKCELGSGANTPKELEVNMFNFRPSNAFSLSNAPKHLQSSISSVYTKYNKYGFNPNLNIITLEFNNRKDLEAKRILFFLESHLGFKKFGFHFQKDYNNSDFSSNTTPLRKPVSSFYCPEWSHTSVYKDNHTISATFIECL